MDANDLWEKELRSARRHPLSALAIGLAIVLVGGLSYGVYAKDRQYKAEASAHKLADTQLAASKSELSTLQDALNQTEEGKKQVEAAKEQSDANAATAKEQASSAQTAKEQADATASAAQQQATAAQASASAATAALNATKEQLASSQSQLASTNTQLSSAKACVALFGSVGSQVGQYGLNMTNALSYISKAGTEGLNGNYSLATTDLNIFQGYYNTAYSLFPQITATLNRVGSGNC